MTLLTGLRSAALLALVVMIALAAGCGGDDSIDSDGLPEGADRAGFTLSPLNRDGAEHGVAYLAQYGKRLRGWVVLWGLEPGSAHASHLHANAPGEPQASCKAAPTKRHAVDFEEMVADENGVATREVDVSVQETVVRPGAYWLVHERGEHDHADHDHDGEHDEGEEAASDNPGLLCGDIVPSGGPS